MSRATAVLNALKAEELLKGSFVLAQIDTLRNSLLYRTNGDTISFDDFYLKLQEKVDALPRLKLETTVATGTENQYIMQLVKAMEEIMDQSDELVRKVIHYQSKLRNAQGQIRKLSAAFNAWYTLAASEALDENGVKFPSNQLKDLANSEFSRLMKNSDVEIDSLLEAVKVQQEQVKQWKKTQQEKFNYGKDQANASWTSGLPNFGEAPEKSDQLLVKPTFPVEEEDEAVPQFVSKRPTLETLVKENQTEDAKRETGKLVDRAIIEIAETEMRLAGLPKPSTEAVERAMEQIQPSEEIKGVFFKRGEAKPVTPIIQDEKPGHVSVAIPVDAQEVLADPKATPEQLKEAFAKEIVTPDPAHDPNVPPPPMIATAPADLTSVFTHAVDVTDAKPAAPKAPRKHKDALAYLVPTADQTIVLRDSDPAEKIKCVVCDRRIRSKQEMFARDGGWAHVNEGDCTGRPATPAPKTTDLDEPGGVLACSPELLRASGGDVNNQAAITATALEVARATAAEGTLLADLEKGAPQAAPAAEATPAADAPATPRKRLTFLDDEAEIM